MKIEAKLIARGVEKEIGIIREYLSDGSASTYEEYKYLTGKIAGLLKINDILGDAAQEDED